MRWRLKHQLYGLRDALKSWQAHLSKITINKGKIQSQTTQLDRSFYKVPGAFQNLKVRLYLH